MYPPNTVHLINEEFLNKFLKKEEYVICIIDVYGYEMTVCVAVDVAVVESLSYEQELAEVLCDCEIVRKNEITMREYKRLMSLQEHNSNNGVIFDKLNIRYREGMFDPLPFKFEEDVLRNEKKNKISLQEACKANSCITEYAGRVGSHLFERK